MQPYRKPKTTMEKQPTAQEVMEFRNTELKLQIYNSVVSLMQSGVVKVDGKTPKEVGKNILDLTLTIHEGVKHQQSNLVSLTK